MLLFNPIFHISELLNFPSLLAIIHLWVCFSGYKQGFFLSPCLIQISFLLPSYVNDILAVHGILRLQAFPHKFAVSSDTQCNREEYACVVVSFISVWLGHGVPRYLDKCYSGCFCEDVSDETNIWIGILSKADCPPWCGWVSSYQLKVWIKQKAWSPSK